MYEDYAELCIETASQEGATYVEARFMDYRNRLYTSDGKGVRTQETTEMTFGVRVIADGMWGFCGSNVTDRESCRKVAQRATRIAKIAATASNRKISLVPTPTIREEYRNSFQRNPFEVQLSEISDILVTSVKNLRNVSQSIKSATASIAAFDERKYVETSEGSEISQHIIGCGSSLQGVALAHGRPCRRSYPQSRPGTMTRGFEQVKEENLPGEAERIGKEILELTKARKCPSGTTTLILQDDLLALQIHETIGHPTESDRALDTEWDFAGSTFLTPEKLARLEFGSELVNVVADATIPGGQGSYGFDDEAVKAKKVDIIKNGLFVGYQTSRETAADLKLSESSGAVRGMTGMHLPLIRMTNINLLPSDWTREEIVEDTKEGVMMISPVMEIFDQRRRTFTFGGEIGWKIEHGEVTQTLRYPVYNGRTAAFWHSCDAIAKDDWTPRGSGCGKGRPHQNVRVGHFCSQARFGNVWVGAAI